MTVSELAVLMGEFVSMEVEEAERVEYIAISDEETVFTVVMGKETVSVTVQAKE